MAVTRTLRLTLVVALLLAAGPVAASEGYDYATGGLEAQPPTLFEKVLDAVLVRPAGLVPTVATAVGCLVGLPVAYAFRTPIETRKICWEDPLEFSITRPLGRF